MKHGLISSASETFTNCCCIGYYNYTYNYFTKAAITWKDEKRKTKNA